VTNLNNDKSVLVRIIDLSPKAAQQLDILRAGVAPARVESAE
jgi:rare lipoprotein A (peptidoglycan hydrolase)